MTTNEQVVRCPASSPWSNNADRSSHLAIKDPWRTGLLPNKAKPPQNFVGSFALARHGSRMELSNPSVAGGGGAWTPLARPPPVRETHSRTRSKQPSPDVRYRHDPARQKGMHQTPFSRACLKTAVHRHLSHVIGVSLASSRPLHRPIRADAIEEPRAPMRRGARVMAATNVG